MWSLSSRASASLPRYLCWPRRSPDTARTPKADPENDPQRQGPQTSVKKLPSTAGIIGVESGRGHVTRKCQPPTVAISFPFHKFSQDIAGVLHSAPLNLSDLVSSLGVEKGGRIEGRFTPLLPSQEVHVFRGFTCPMTLHYPWRVLKSLKKTNAMFIMVYSLQEPEKNP